MKEISKEVLHDAASRLLFDMDEGEYDALLQELTAITQAMQEVAKIEGIQNESSMTFPFECPVSYLREDIPESPLSREEALKNAGSVEEGQIKLPKVV